MTNDKKAIQHRIIDAAVDIRQEESASIEYQHGILCQVGLPRKKQDTRIFERTFKNASLLVEAGKLWDGRKWVEQPLPSGPKPRLALIHINSEAVRTQNPQVEIGRSCAEFLRRIGLPDQDGRTYNLFKRQMMALAAARLTMGFTLPDRAITVDAKPIKEFQAWLSDNEQQPALWPGFLQLSQEYYESLLAHAVPLDPRAIGALSHTALGLDWYSFLARRLHELDRSVRVPFASLQEQFGQEYKGKNAADDFQKELLKINKQVLAVYPAAKIERATGALILYPSHPPIRTAIKGCRVAQEKPEPLPLASPIATLLERTTEQFREICPRLDVYACKSDFDAWLNGKEQPRNYQKAFLGFAKKWAKGKK
jgi:hypothetical protein